MDSKRFIILIIVFFIVSTLNLFSMEFKGNGWIRGIQIRNEDIIVAERMDIYCTWKIWNLLGEPVKFCEVICVIPNNLSIDSFSSTLNNTKIPSEVVEEISIVDVDILLKIPKAGTTDESYVIAIDAGAISKPYFGKISEINNLSKEQKKKLLSFSVQGSPKWEELFQLRSFLGGYSSVSAKKAKELFQHQLQDINENLTEANVTFDLSSIEFWLKGLKKVETFLNDAESAFSSQKYQESINLYKKVLEIEDDNQKAITGLKKAEDALNKLKTEETEENKEVIKPIKDGMIFVQSGTFKMGSNDGKSNEKPVHTVTVSDFYIGKYEVTQKEWKEVMGNNPSDFKGDNLPVEQVSWYDAVEFCNKMSEKEGLQKCYTINKSRKDSNNKSDYDDIKWTVTCNFNANGYRLPTEAEWEYAARGGNKSRNYKYSGSNTIGNVAWYDSNSTHPVGTKQSNELSIYDMSGNVWEWCGDWYDENYYSSSPRNNPQGRSFGSARVGRGGSWNHDAYGCRVADRSADFPDYSRYSMGFRIARSSN